MTIDLRQLFEIQNYYNDILIMYIQRYDHYLNKKFVLPECKVRFLLNQEIVVLTMKKEQML